MKVVAWMECNLGHMWPSDLPTECPVCGAQGWLHTESVEPAAHQTRAMVIKNVAELDEEIRHLRQVVAEQARHHQISHPTCLGYPNAAPAEAL